MFDCYYIARIYTVLSQSFKMVMSAIRRVDKSSSLSNAVRVMFVIYFKPTVFIDRFVFHNFSKSKLIGFAVYSIATSVGFQVFILDKELRSSATAIVFNVSMLMHCCLVLAIFLFVCYLFEFSKKDTVTAVMLFFYLFFSGQCLWMFAVGCFVVVVRVVIGVLGNSLLLSNIVDVESLHRSVFSAQYALYNCKGDVIVYIIIFIYFAVYMRRLFGISFSKSILMDFFAMTIFASLFGVTVSPFLQLIFEYLI